MKLNCYLAVVPAGAAFLVAGCTNITMLRTEELRAVSSRVDSLSVQLVEEQGKLARQQKEQTELLRSMRADLQVKLGQLEQRLTALETGVSESQSRLSNIDRKTQEIRERWDERVKADSTMQESKEAETEQFFQIAYGDFAAGRFDLSLNGFTDIVSRYPGTPQAQQALYWQAEVYYAQKAYDKAQNQYVKYIKTYPEGDKVCPALYKLGLVYEKLGKNKSRAMVWEKLVNQCPDSQEARAARSRLQ